MALRHPRMVPMRTSAPRTRSQIRPLPYLRTDLSADGAACLNVSSPRAVCPDQGGATGPVRWPHRLPDRSGANSQAIHRTHARTRMASCGPWTKPCLTVWRLAPFCRASGSRPLDDRLTFGDQMANRVARFGGSWPLILVFVGVLGGLDRHERSGPAAAALRSLPLTWYCPASPPCRRQSS